MLYIVVEGELTSGGLGQVLLSLEDAEELYKKLGRFFGEKKLNASSTPLTPFPKIDVPPLTKEPVPGTEKQKTLADYLREMNERTKQKPVDLWPNPTLPPDWHRYPTTPVSLNPGIYSVFGVPNDWKAGDPVDPKWTAAASVDYNAIRNNTVFPASPKKDPQ